MNKTTLVFCAVLLSIATTFFVATGLTSGSYALSIVSGMLAMICIFCDFFGCCIL